jgi:Fic family protein
LYTNVNNYNEVLNSVLTACIGGAGQTGWVGIIDQLFESPIITSQAVQQQFGVSRPTAANSLRRLEGMGIVQEVAGRQRNLVYAAQDILNAIVAEA